MGGSNRGWGHVGMRHQASELLKLESRVHQQLNYLYLELMKLSMKMNDEWPA